MKEVADRGPDRSPSISVLIVTHNRREELARCIHSVEEQTSQPLEIVVYDNGSTDGTPAMVRETYPEIKLIAGQENVGCPRGRNRGVQACSGEYVLCVDDDGTLRGEAIAALTQRLQDTPGLAVVAGSVVDAFHAPLETLTPGPVFTFSGGIAALHRETFMRLGGYHEDGLREGEEAEFSFLLHQAGEVVYRDPRVVLDHHVDGSRARRGRIIRASARQTVLTALKVVPFALLPVWLSWKLIQQVINARRYGMTSEVFAGVKDAIPQALTAIRNHRTVPLRTVMSSTRWYVPPKNMPTQLRQALAL